jgi:ATP-dependent Clp protease protease subunit
MGAVMSIAALVFQACDNRMLYPSTRFMIHNGSYAGFSKDEQQNHIIDRAKEMEVVNRKYAEVLAYHSRQPLRKVLNWCRGDKFFSAEQAVKAGFADSVMGTEPLSVRSRP